MKKYFPAISTGVAVLFMVLFFTKSCDRPVTKPDDGVAWRLRVDSLSRLISNRDTAILHVRQKKALDSIQNLEAVNRLKIREASLVRKLKEANADIQEIADSLPKVRRYVELADSTIAVKDSLYIQAVNHTIALEQFYKLETAALAQKNVIQVQLSDQYKARVDELGKENARLGKKLERKKVGNRILLGVSAGLLTAVGVMALTN